MTETTVRIGTWNILGRRNKDNNEQVTSGAISNLIRNNRVDILSLQEVHFYNGSPDQQLIAELHSAGLSHFSGASFSPSHLDPTAELGVAIAAKFPLLKFRKYRLNNPGLTAIVRGANWTLHDKGMVSADVQLSCGQSLSIHALHLFPFFEFGINEHSDHVRRMWEEFWPYVDKVSRCKKTVLAGDYNQTSRVNAAKEYSELPWHFRAADMTTTTNGMSLDDIAVNWGTASSSAKPRKTFSDHHLVVATIAL